MIQKIKQLFKVEQSKTQRLYREWDRQHGREDGANHEAHTWGHIGPQGGRARARRKVKASKIVILPSANASMVAKISPTIAKAPRTRAV
jgi:hypothetical protein